jgi:transcriptional regulator with XRE-family HTH domain
MSRLPKIAAAVSTVALVGAGGVGVAEAATTSQKAAATSRSAHPGREAGRLAAIARMLGVTPAQLRAALNGSRPAKPVRRRPAPGGGIAAQIAAALGVPVAAVQAVLDANRPAKAPSGRRPVGVRPPMPGYAQLVTALARRLGLSDATVRAALARLDASGWTDNVRHEQARYAAIAKRLGLSVGAVQAAFEAN